MSYNTKNYTEQGGEVTHIGGKLEFGADAQVSGFPYASATSENPGAVKMAANQAASTATTVEGVVADLNTLIASLKASGVMAPDEPESNE